MGRFDRQIETAKRLIAKNGMVCKWKQVSKIVDPAAPFMTQSQTEQIYDVALCFVPAETVQYMVGSDVPAASIVALMAQVPFTPRMKDTVLRGMDTLRVAQIQPLAPNGQNILYAVIFE